VAHYDVTPEALADLEANPDVVSISPNQAVHSFIDRVTCSADYWPLYSYFTSIHRSYAAELGIAILDSGVNSANPNFHNPQSFRVCLLYDDGPTPRRIEPLLIFTDVEVPVGVEVAAQV
jgi:hypothetical protein